MWALRPSEVGYTAACKQRMSHNPAAKDGVIDAGCTIMGSETYIVLVGNGFTTIGRGEAPMMPSMRRNRKRRSSKQHTFRKTLDSFAAATLFGFVATGNFHSRARKD